MVPVSVEVRTLVLASLMEVRMLVQAFLMEVRKLEKMLVLVVVLVDLVVCKEAGREGVHKLREVTV